MAKNVTNPLQKPVEDKLGPAMMALNARQRAFVVASFSADNHTDAAIQAGYTTNAAAAKVQACRMLQQDKIKLAMVEFARGNMAALIPMAIERLEKEIRSDDSKDGVKASLAVLNRAGLHEAVEHTININISRQEKIAEIRQLAELLGQDPAQVLGILTDGEYTDVTPTTVPDDEEVY